MRSFQEWRATEMLKRQKEQDERRRLAGSTNETTTYRDRAAADLNLESGGGRYGAIASVNGSEPFVRYPASSPPWAGGDNIPEPALGWSVEDVEPCGTYPEIQASLETCQLAEPPGSNASPPFPGVVEPGVRSSPELAEVLQRLAKPIAASMKAAVMEGGERLPSSPGLGDSADQVDASLPDQQQSRSLPSLTPSSTPTIKRRLGL
jgi:hypothetical protein